MGQAKRRGTYEQRRAEAERKKSDRLHALIIDAEQSRTGRRPEINMLDALLEMAFVGSLKAPRREMPVPPPILLVDDEHDARGMRAHLPEVEIITLPEIFKDKQ